MMNQGAIQSIQKQQKLYKQRSAETSSPAQKFLTFRQENNKSVPNFLQKNQVVYPTQIQDIKQQINSLSSDPTCSRFVVAGKDLLKIFSISEEKKFDELLNLRHRHQPTWKYTTLDVSWNLVDSHKILTGTSTGSVIVWDISGQFPSKIANTYKDTHTNLIRAVTWNPKDPNKFATGSVDGQARIWDIRDEEGVKRTYKIGKTEVRDLKFKPNSPHLLAATYENGSILAWDQRYPDKPVNEWPQQPLAVLAIDWSPFDDSLFVTGAMDKYIKIWSMNEKHALKQIKTMANVGEVQWRNRNFICSTANINDNHLHIWNTNLTSIQQYIYSGHRKVISGFFWNGGRYRNSGNYLVTGGKDQTIQIQHFSKGKQPLKLIPPSASALSPTGLLASVAVNIPTREASKFFQKVNPNELCFINKLEGPTNFSFQQQSELIKKYQRKVSQSSTLVITLKQNQKIAFEAGCFQGAEFWARLVSILQPSELIQEHEIKKKSEKKNILFCEQKGNGQIKKEPFCKFNWVNKLKIKSSIRETKIQASQPKQFKMQFFKKKKIQEKVSEVQQSLVSNQVISNNLETEQFQKFPQFEGMKNQIIEEQIQSANNSGLIATAFVAKLLLQEYCSQGLCSNLQESMIELLRRNRDHQMATRLLKQSKTEGIQKQNQAQTQVELKCGFCKKSKMRGTSHCSECERKVNCSVCQNPVKGLFVWCQGCAHGGHMNHVSEWFTSNEFCPTGCGHRCNPPNESKYSKN